MNPLQISLFPNPQEILLLKAALFPPETALEAWKKWLDSTGYNQLDLKDENFLAHFFDPLAPAVWELTPLIHTNLERFNDPIASRLKGYKRRVWVQNQQIMYSIQSILTILDSLGIEHILLDDLPMATFHYPNPALRAIRTSNIWIPDSCKTHVLEALLKHGFAPHGFSVEYALGHAHGILLYKKAYSIENQVFIHWNLFYEHAHHPNKDTQFWENRVRYEYQSIKSKMLQPTHQFFSCVAQGRNVSAQAGLKWIADAYLLHQKQSIDWQQIIDLSIHYHFVPFMSKALAFLKAEFGVAVPDFVAETFHNTKLTPATIAYQTSISQNIRSKGRFHFGTALLKRNYYLYQGFKKTWMPKPFLLWFGHWSYARLKVLILNRLKKVR